MRTEPNSKTIKLRIAAEGRRIERMMGSLSQLCLFTSAIDPEADRLKTGLTRRAAELQAIRDAMAVNPAKALFDEVLAYLRQPLFTLGREARKSDWVGVAEEEPENEAADPWERAIPCEPWGEPWVTDKQGHAYSTDAIAFLMAKIFWSSMDEMSGVENGEQKLDVLKWVFKPSVRKTYVYDARIGKSHCLQWHERDETFSFHNCCMAARVDEEEIRNGFRRNIPAEIIQAVERYYAH